MKDNRYVRPYGLRLPPDLYAELNPLGRAEAQHMEQVLARQLKEPAFFYKVHNIVARYDKGEYGEGAAKVRADHQLILNGEGVEFHIGGRVITHEEFFNTWLNGYTVHQDAFEDPTKRGAYEAFIALGLTPAVEAVVQKVALQLAGCIIRNGRRDRRLD